MFFTTVSNACNSFSMGNFVSDRNGQTFQNNEGINPQSQKEVIDGNNSLESLENKSIITSSSTSPPVSTADCNGENCKDDLDESHQETISKEQKHESLKNKNETKFDKVLNIPLTDIFRKKLVVFKSNCCNDMMVNSTALHPKTRNPTNSTATNSNSNSTSNNSAAASRDSTAIKEHIIDDSIMLVTGKSPLSTESSVIEVIIV